MSIFTLMFVDEHSSHHDLLLTIPSIGFTQVMDTYYYWLDKRIGDDVEDKSRAVLTSMLKKWISMIHDLEVGQLCFLALDLSDQYIGCFKAELTEPDVIELTYGFTEKIIGMDVVASQPDLSGLTTSDFEPDASPVRATREELLATIRSNINMISLV